MLINTVENEIEVHDHAECGGALRAVNDTMEILGGKWKITIISALSFGKKRFMQLQRDVNGIGAKMLSKELYDLEINGIVSRTVRDTKPVTVEYELTPYGETLKPILAELMKWGTNHRKRIIGEAGG